MTEELYYTQLDSKKLKGLIMIKKAILFFALVSAATISAETEDHLLACRDCNLVCGEEILQDQLACRDCNLACVCQEDQETPKQC